MPEDSGPDRWLEQILRTDNLPPLPATFAGKVARKAAHRIMLRQHLTEFLTYAAALLLPLLILLGILFFTGRETWKEWAAWMISARDLLGGGGVVLLFVLFTDRVVLPWLFFTRQQGNGEVQS